MHGRGDLLLVDGGCGNVYHGEVLKNLTTLHTRQSLLFHTWVPVEIGAKRSSSATLPASSKVVQSIIVVELLQ